MSTNEGSSTRNRRFVRTAVAGALTAVALFGVTAPASAHVHVEASTTTPGRYTQLTFRVPTESETASTTKLEITLPSDTPFASVSAKQLAGWDVKVIEAKLPTPITSDGATLTKAARTVTWTAHAGQGIAPGRFQTFDLLVGPLPESGTVTLPAVQTYSDATIVAWDQPTPPDGDEPEHPAPSITVSASATRSDGHTDDHASDNAPSTTSAASTDSAARALGVAGIVVGAVGAGIGVAGVRAASRKGTHG